MGHRFHGTAIFQKACLSALWPSFQVRRDPGAVGRKPPVGVLSGPNNLVVAAGAKAISTVDLPRGTYFSGL
jgi:hypothetical protein